MWDVQSTISSSLHGSKDTSTSGCPGEADIEVATEGSVLSLLVLLVELITVHLELTLVDAIQTKLLQQLQHNMTNMFHVHSH